MWPIMMHEQLKSMTSDTAAKVVKAPKKPTKGKVKAKTRVAKPKKLDPTRYGDWEKGGRCIDF